MATKVINPNFNIASSVSCNCDIKVEDTTNYSTYGSVREDYAIALFYSNDNFASVSYTFANAGSTGVPGIWNITNPAGGGIYKIKAFIVGVYDAGNAYNTLDITYYNGVFYYATAAINQGDPVPGINSNWVNVLGFIPIALFVYGHFINNINSATPTYIDWTISNVHQYCGDISLTHTSCYNYNVCNTTQSTEFFSVTDLAGTVITDVTFGDANATAVLDNSGKLLGWSLPTGICTAMILPKEGVYLINYGSSITCMNYQKVVFELCKYYDCYFGLIKQILCNDYDPCCDSNTPHKAQHKGFLGFGRSSECFDCNDEKKKEHELFRLTLNKMQALINVIQIKTFYDTIHYGSILNVTANRLTELSEIQDMINMLNKLIIRCGLCNGAWSNEVKSDCGCYK